MKIKGLEIYMKGICLGETNNKTFFLPFPQIRRYEEIKVASSKDRDGNIIHNPSMKYRIRFHRDPLSIGLSRKAIIHRLKSDNQDALSKGIENIITKEYLFSKY